MDIPAAMAISQGRLAQAEGNTGGVSFVEGEVPMDLGLVSSAEFVVDIKFPVEFTSPMVHIVWTWRRDPAAPYLAGGLPRLDGAIIDLLTVRRTVVDHIIGARVSLTLDAISGTRGVAQWLATARGLVGDMGRP